MSLCQWFIDRITTAAKKLLSRAHPAPRDWPNLAPPEPIPADAADHAQQFALTWYDRLEAFARRRLRELGIPDHQIGAFDHDFDLRLAAFHPKERTGGGVSPGGRINLNRRRQAHPASNVGKGTMMVHNLTIGHLDPAAIVNERRIAVLHPLELDVVDRLLNELGGIDDTGARTLEKGKVEFRDGYLVCPWRIGGWHNRTAEEFALRLQQETGCVLADREHSRIIEPEQLQGLDGAATAAGRNPGEANHSPHAST